MKFFSQPRGRLAIRSRRTIVWMALSLFVCNAAVALVLDQFRPDLRDPEFQLVSEALHQRIAERPNDRLVLFMGSSRIALGLDAGELCEPGRLVFNFGMPGAGPLMMDINWDRLTEEGIRPDEVIIEFMHPFYNGANGRTLDHSFLDASRLSVQEARSLVGYGNRSTSSLRRMGIARIFPAGKHGQELCDALGAGRLHARKKTIESDGHGYRAMEILPAKRDEMRELAHRQYDSYYPEFVLAGDPANRLRTLILKARQSGARVRLLLTPEGSEFRELMSPAMVTAINRFTSELASETGIEIIDARYWMPDDAFYDQHHLLPAGGKLLAERLKSRLR